jgi:hypothetical protein
MFRRITLAIMIAALVSTIAGSALAFAVHTPPNFPAGEIRGQVLPD